MKKLIQITVNGNSNTDAIIYYFMNPNCDPEGRIIYSDPANGIAKCKGYPTDVDIYAYTHPSGKKGLRKITLTSHSIKAIHKALMEIETIESEEFAD